MRRRTFVTACLLATTLAAACTTTRHVWRKTGITDDQAQREQATCLYNAEVLCGTQYNFTEIELHNRHERFRVLYDQCMRAAGYQDHVIEE